MLASNEFMPFIRRLPLCPARFNSKHFPIQRRAPIAIHSAAHTHTHAETLSGAMSLSQIARSIHFLRNRGMLRAPRASRQALKNSRDRKRSEKFRSSLSRYSLS